MDFKDLAQVVDTAAMHAKATEQLSRSSEFSVDEAYEIQRISIERRKDRGERIIGLKMGFTSKAKMEQMGVHDMIWGRLTNKMDFSCSKEISLASFIHPRAEPEVCFRISKDIDKELSLEEVKEYVNGIAPAIEIIDSRYENFKFSLEDVIADNCSSSGLVIGSWFEDEINISDLSIDLIVNGETVHNGNSNAILGDPWESMVAVTRLAHKYGEKISKGDIIMAGAATPAVFLKENDEVIAKVEKLGEVSFNVRS